MKTVLKIILVLFCFSTFSMYAQDLIVPKQGNPITAYNVESSAKFYFYTTTPDADAPIFRIAKDSVLVVRYADGRSETAPSEQTEVSAPSSPSQEDVKQYPIIKEEDIHGCLIEKGNCVYIPTDGPYPFEKAGQEKVKEIVSEWGYWTVVDKPEQAHFILQYIFTSSGRDLSWLMIRPRKYYRAASTLVWSNWSGCWTAKSGIILANEYSSEDLNHNVSNAITLTSRLKTMIFDTESYNAKQFRKYKRYFNADYNKENWLYLK